MASHHGKQLFSFKLKVLFGNVEMVSVIQLIQFSFICIASVARTVSSHFREMQSLTPRTVARKNSLLRRVPPHTWGNPLADCINDDTDHTNKPNSLTLRWNESYHCSILPLAAPALCPSRPITCVSKHLELPGPSAFLHFENTKSVYELLSYRCVWPI